MILAVLLACSALSVSAYPSLYRTEQGSQRNRIISPTRQEMEEFYEFLQQLNMREPGNREVEGDFLGFPRQDDDDLGIYVENEDDTIDQPEYFDYPRYIPYMPLKKRGARRPHYDDYEEVLPEQFSYQAEPDRDEGHPDALRQLESLLSDKRHNSDDSVRQLHSLLNSKSKRSVTPTPTPEKQNKTGNSIVVTVYENEQAAHEKAAVSKDGQKEVALLRPATLKHKTEQVEQDYPETEVEDEPSSLQLTVDENQSVEETESQENSDVSSEGIDFPSRLRKRFVTPTDSLMNELHGLKHE